MTDSHPDPSSDETFETWWKTEGSSQLVHKNASRIAWLAGRHSIASGEGVGVEPSLGSSQGKALTQQLRALALSWHRSAEAIRYHQVEEAPESQAHWDWNAQTLFRCAEELEKIVGPADPF